MQLPRLPANALLVYRLTPGYDPESICSGKALISFADFPRSRLLIVDTLFLPLLTHTAHPSETHYHSLAPSFPRGILLHTHASAPYIASEHRDGHKLTIYSSGECWVDELELSVDWWASIGRWGARYGTAAVCWAVGIVAALMWDWWRLVEGGGKHSSHLPAQCNITNAHLAPIPDVHSSLSFFARRRLPWIMLLSYFVSLLPLRVGLWLGNRGNAAFAPFSALILPIAFGLVCVMWWLLLVLMWPLRLVLKRFGRYEYFPSLV